jgi:hypothetical protein
LPGNQPVSVILAFVDNHHWLIRMNTSNLLHCLLAGCSLKSVGTIISQMGFDSAQPSTSYLASNIAD